MIRIEFAGTVFQAWRIAPWQSILKRGMTGLESVVRIRDIEKPPFSATCNRAAGISSIADLDRQFG